MTPAAWPWIRIDRDLADPQGAADALVALAVFRQAWTLGPLVEELGLRWDDSWKSHVAAAATRRLEPARRAGHAQTVMRDVEGQAAARAIFQALDATVVGSGALRQDLREAVEHEWTPGVLRRLGYWEGHFWDSLLGISYWLTDEDLIRYRAAITRETFLWRAEYEALDVDSVHALAANLPLVGPAELVGLVRALLMAHKTRRWPGQSDLARALGVDAGAVVAGEEATVEDALAGLLDACVREGVLFRRSRASGDGYAPGGDPCGAGGIVQVLYQLAQVEAISPPPGRLRDDQACCSMPAGALRVPGVPGAPTGDLRQVDLVDRTGHHPGTISRDINRLRDAGLIDKRNGRIVSWHPVWNFLVQAVLAASRRTESTSPNRSACAQALAETLSGILRQGGGRGRQSVPRGHALYLLGCAPKALIEVQDQGSELAATAGIYRMGPSPDATFQVTPLGLAAIGHCPTCQKPLDPLVQVPMQDEGRPGLPHHLDCPATPFQTPPPPFGDAARLPACGTCHGHLWARPTILREALQADTAAIIARRGTEERDAEYRWAYLVSDSPIQAVLTRADLVTERITAAVGPGDERLEAIAAAKNDVLAVDLMAPLQAAQLAPAIQALVSLVFPGEAAVLRVEEPTSKAIQAHVERLVQEAHRRWRPLAGDSVTVYVTTESAFHPRCAPRGRK